MGYGDWQGTWRTQRPTRAIALGSLPTGPCNRTTGARHEWIEVGMGQVECKQCRTGYIEWSSGIIEAKQRRNQDIDAIMAELERIRGQVIRLGVEYGHELGLLDCLLLAFENRQQG